MHASTSGYCRAELVAVAVTANKVCCVPVPLLVGAARLPVCAELTTTMKELGDLLTADEIAQFVKLMDTDNDGVVGVSTARCLHMSLCSRTGVSSAGLPWILLLILLLDTLYVRSMKSSCEPCATTCPCWQDGPPRPQRHTARHGRLASVNPQQLRSSRQRGRRAGCWWESRVLWRKHLVTLCEPCDVRGSKAGRPAN